MTFAIAFMLGGFVLLYLGGEWLVRGAGDLAIRLGMAPFVVGMTVVAFATSSPELAVSIDATLEQVDDVAVGNVVGSNICNIALVLGLASLIRPIQIHARVLRFDVPLLIACTALMVLLLRDGLLSRMEGALLLVGLVAFITQNIVMARRERDLIRQEFEGQAPPTAKGPFWDGLYILGGLVALVAGGELFVDGAVRIASELGVSAAIISLSLVALGTSLPELATSIVASIKGEGDITAGNVIGSNFFNILGILGVTALVDPLRAGGVQMSDHVIMLGFTLLLLPLMFSRLKVGRIEGLLLLAGYGGYLWFLAERGMPG